MTETSPQRTKPNRVISAVALGFLGTFAIAMVAMHPLFALLAAGGLVYLGYQVADRVRTPETTAGQFAYLYVWWTLVFLLPFGAVMAFVYVFAEAGRTYGEWTVLGIVFVAATFASYLLQEHLESKERDPADPADKLDR